MEIAAVTDDAQWFVPDVGTNRSSAKPFRVLVKPLSGAQKNRLQAQHMGKVTKGGNVMSAAEKTVRDIVRTNVAEVENCTWRKTNGETVDVKNGSQLYEALMSGPAELADVVDQIVEFAESVSELSEQAEGNFD